MILKLKHYLENPTKNESEYDVVRKGYIISVNIDDNKVELIQDKKKLNKNILLKRLTFLQRLLMK